MDDDDIFRGTLHPGPIDDSLLGCQHNHRSQHIWYGDLAPTQTLVPETIVSTWNFFRANPPHERVSAYISPFMPLLAVGRIELDHALLTALVERWRPETHTFHLPFGEVTITLEDVHVLFGLPCDGFAVTYDHPHAGDGLPEYWTQKLERLTGYTQAPENLYRSRSYCLYNPLLEHLQLQLHEHPITADTPDARVNQIARMYVLLLFGGILFPSTTTNCINLRVLPCLDDLRELHTYSWGSAVLAALYRNMCRASMGKARRLAGCSLLLQLWAWERIIPLRPQLAPRSFMDPLAARWSRPEQYAVHDVRRQANSILTQVRDILDMLKIDQFIWTPYAGILQQLPLYCTGDLFMCRARCALIYVDIIEYHAPDRVTRQFEITPHVPESPGWDMMHYERDDRFLYDQTFSDLHATARASWGQRCQSWIEHVDGANERAYRDWYLRHGRLLVGHRSLSDAAYLPLIDVVLRMRQSLQAIAHAHPEALSLTMAGLACIDALHIIRDPVALPRVAAPARARGRGRGRGRRGGGRVGGREGGRGRARGRGAVEPPTADAFPEEDAPIVHGPDSSSSLPSEPRVHDAGELQPEPQPQPEPEPATPEYHSSSGSGGSDCSPSRKKSKYCKDKERSNGVSGPLPSSSIS